MSSGPQLAPGTHTLAEILSQPKCWRECLAALEENNQLGKIQTQCVADAEWLFVGCGSSHYIALVAAASWTALTGRRAKAVPASELLLFPDLVLTGSAPYQPVLVSRSGHTSEVLQAAEYLELQRNIRTLAISCATHQPLEEICAATLYLLPADEKSTVMTRSFTSMLLGLQSLAAALAKKSAFSEALHRLPTVAQAALDSMQPCLGKFVQAHEFADYVFLAQGPYFGLASESQLKVKEMSCSYAQVFHALEFRHGPKAIVGPETLVTFLLSESAYETEREVLEEIKGLGATTLVVTNIADAAARCAADLLIELKLDVPEYARLAAYIFAGQLLGFYTGLKKGYDPDRPRNLSRAVILSNNGK
jgi:glucosamine--fructose-6-phosphate aminotransferase (isomerizing)